MKQLRTESEAMGLEAETVQDEWLGLRVLKAMNLEKYDTELYEF